MWYEGLAVCSILQYVFAGFYRIWSKISKVVKSAQEVFKSSSEMIDLRLESLMPEIGRRAAPKFVANLCWLAYNQNSPALDPIRTNTKVVGIKRCLTPRPTPLAEWTPYTLALSGPIG